MPSDHLTGAGLKRLRERDLRVTQRGLADALDVDPATVSRWERGTRPIPKVAVLALRTLARARPRKGGKRRR